MLTRAVLVAVWLLVAYQTLAVTLHSWPTITDLHHRYGWPLWVASTAALTAVVAWAVWHLGRAALP